MLKNLAVIDQESQYPVHQNLTMRMLLNETLFDKRLKVTVCEFARLTAFRRILGQMKGHGDTHLRRLADKPVQKCTVLPADSVLSEPPDKLRILPA